MSDFSGELSSDDAGRLIGLADSVPYVRRLGAGGTFLYVGDNFQSVLGHDPDDLVAHPKNWSRWIHPDEAEAVAAAIENGGTNPTEIEYRLCHAAGHQIWLRDRFIVCHIGEPRLIGCWTDITQTQRQRAQVHQREKLEVVGRLTGGVAHEFNNLLGVVLGNLELVEFDLPEGSQSHQYVRRAKQSVMRGADLTRRLLSVASLQPHNASPINIGIFANELERALALILGDCIDLHVAVATDVPTVLTDGVQLETAILSLGKNALDAMPNGGKLTLSVDVENRARDGIGPAEPLVRISVSDTGVGMAPETAVRAAEPFFTTKDVGEGEGLGLSVVFGMAEQSGGFAEIESALGAGTTVSIYLPVGAPC